MRQRQRRCAITTTEQLARRTLARGYPCCRRRVLRIGHDWAVTRLSSERRLVVGERHAIDRDHVEPHVEVTEPIGGQPRLGERPDARLLAVVDGVGGAAVSRSSGAP